MAKDIKLIIDTIDNYLEVNHKNSTNPVEANAMLEREGVLKDSQTHKGKPLRDILRAGLIPHAYQSGGKGSDWVIPHSPPKHKQD